MRSGARFSLAFLSPEHILQRGAPSRNRSRAHPEDAKRRSVYASIMSNTIVASTEARLLQALRPLGSPERAEQEKRYQKSRWDHWGVPLPSMGVAIKKTLGDLSQEQALDLCRRLWREPVWDLKIVAGRILARKSIAPDAKVWGFVTERMPELDGWAVADNLASVASRCLIEDPGRLDVVETWIENPHLWTRRAALVFTLPWAKEKRDPERMLGWAVRLAEDPEWFIQKAIGWWLRALSKRDPNRVRMFLTEHGEKLRGVAKREATKYLTA
jgi:3-methyladenine DNA glycosylase AlkD